MPCCCVTGCHNRAEKGHKLYKLPQGHKNEIRRKLWIQNIGRTSPLPLHAYVCQVKILFYVLRHMYLYTCNI